MCHCGRPLHYNSQGVQAFVEKQIAKLGETVPVTAPDANGVYRSWLVPRHFIALHGIKAAEVYRLGFEEAPGAV
jgi:hypothetical protein